MITIIEKVRNLIADNEVTNGVDVFTYESSTSSKVFTLTESNISAASIVVYKNGVVWASSNYSYNLNTGKLTVTGTLTAGDSLEVNYTYYTKYSDSEITGYIKAALTYLCVERYETFTVESGDVLDPEPTEAQEHLIALVASILIKGSIKSYRTPEISITFNDNDSLELKIRKAIRQFDKAFGVMEYIDPTATWDA